MTSHTTDNRFQISCSYCGHIDAETNLIDAVATAQRVKAKHNSPDEHIEIFDLMAHKGYPELYTDTGKPVAFRTK
jgi:hypothetical protein